MGKSELIPWSFAGVMIIDYAWYTEKIRPFIFQEAVAYTFGLCGEYTPYGHPVEKGEAISRP
jgi:hypothetical protein